jgi:hypothetical protein
MRSAILGYCVFYSLDKTRLRHCRSSKEHRIPCYLWMSRMILRGRKRMIRRRIGVVMSEIGPTHNPLLAHYIEMDNLRSLKK